jgi:hypothetical protein
VIRHVVNFGLLFAFLGLSVTGVMAFALPFSIATTRVHIVFGALTLLLVIAHLLSRTRYFSGKLAGKGSARGMVAAVAVAVAMVAAVAVAGWWPTGAAIGLGYEARNRAAIVRESPLAGFLDGAETRWVVREASDPELPSLALAMRMKGDPAVAVWVESTTGTMIETLYLPDALAYSEEVGWQGVKTERNRLLPIWRHRFTMVSGVEPSGEVDLYSAATRTHSFQLEQHLRDGKELVLCVEVNAVRDPDEAWTDAELGQPSLLYTAYFEPAGPGGYQLLELTAHGGGASEGGTLEYDFDAIGSASEIVDLLLAKLGK